MDLEQKYTEEIEFGMHTDFEKKLRDQPDDVIDDIIEDIAHVLESLPKRDDFTQFIGGVCLLKDPIYYVLEYFNEQEKFPVLVDLHFTDVDEYLDLINESNTIKSYK